MGAGDADDPLDDMEADHSFAASGFASLVGVDGASWLVKGLLTTSTQEPTVTSIQVDLFLALDDGGPSGWNPNEVFASAMHGLFEAMLPAVCVVESVVHAAGDLVFARDVECRAPSIDRHGSYLVQKKAKERASNAVGRALKHSIYGNSRSPSRASSRAQSRVSAALTTSVMAMKMAKLAFGKPPPSSQGDAPFAINEWNESEAGAGSLKGGSHTFEPYAAMSSRFSLASSRLTARTSRMPVDYQEVHRREEIMRDIDTREGRERLTARIQRKGELKLKLRSLADPTVSVDREEYEALKKTRGAMMSRGKSRGGLAAATGGSQPVGLSRANSMIDSNAFGTTTSRSIETTYRPEDYEDLNSELVIMDKKGELLVGENCFLIARKPRSELENDLLQRNTIKPRVHFPLNDPELNENESANDVSPESATDLKATSRHSPNRSVSRQSPVRIASTQKSNPVFEGHDGTFQLYPKIELDPKKTPLAKGVTIKAPEPPSVAPTALKEIVNPPSNVKAKKKPLPHSDLKSLLSEDHANDSLESEMKKMITNTDKSKQQGGHVTSQHLDAHSPSGKHTLGAENSARPSARATKPESSVSPEYALPVKNHQAEKHQLQSLRLRTPAYGNRNVRSGATVLGISLDEVGDEDSDDLHLAVDETATLCTPNKLSGTANLPRFSPYRREFPSPPNGHVHVVSASTTTAMLTSPATTKSVFPFSSLPSVVRGKR